LKILKHRNEWLKKDTLLAFLVTRSLRYRHRRESPHKLPAKLLNSFPVAVGRDFGTASSAAPDVTLRSAPSKGAEV